MFLVGLTGNAGSGKTTALEIFRRYGFCVIDADKVVSRLLEREDVRKFISETFGEEFIHDRRKFSRFLFSNESAMRTYEMFIRKKVVEEVMQEIRNCKGENVVVEGALIFEYGIESMFDCIVTIVADEEKLVERLMKKGYDEEHARNILKFQLPQEEKARRSDYVIRNDGTLEEFSKRVERLIEEKLKERLQ